LYYFATDFFLLLGVFSVFALDAAKLGWAGAGALAVFVLGILLVRSPQVTLFGTGGYQTGAAIALVGIASLGILMLLRQTAVVSPILWLAALITGLAGAGGVLPYLASAAAGILFGAGFVAAGVRLLRSN